MINFQLKRCTDLECALSYFDVMGKHIAELFLRIEHIGPHAKPNHHATITDLPT